jgi:hypothetical protein
VLMSETFITKTAAVFSVLVIVSEIAGPAIGIPRGVLAPVVADFGTRRSCDRACAKRLCSALAMDVGARRAIPCSSGGPWMVLDFAACRRHRIL